MSFESKCREEIGDLKQQILFLEHNLRVQGEDINNGISIKRLNEKRKKLHDMEAEFKKICPGG